jgi:nuclear transport factor 2 (NTF2) superfamily protein
MPDTYNYPRSFAENRIANRRARRLVFDAADGLLVYGNEAADYAARMIRSLRAAGLREDRIESLKEKLEDTFADVQGGIDKTLDDEGLAADGHQIDLTEIV